MPTLWIASDQKRDVTGRFYAAYARRLVDDVATRWRIRPIAVQLRFFDLGKLENYPREVAAKLRDTTGADDLLLVVRDTEDRDEAAVRQNEQLLWAVEAAGLPRQRLESLLIPPMTEAAYLADEQMLGAVVAWANGRNKVSRHDRQVSLDKLREVGQQRQQRARRPRDIAALKKAVVVEALGNPDKASLSKAMADFVDGTTYELPRQGVVPELDRLRRWLDARLGGVEVCELAGDVISEVATRGGHDHAWHEHQQSRIHDPRGFVAVRAHDSAEIGHTWFDRARSRLHGVFVEPGHPAEVGRALVRAAVEACATAGHGTVLAPVLLEDWADKRLWETTYQDGEATLMARLTWRPARPP